jgi:hypothetical protein
MIFHRYFKIFHGHLTDISQIFQDISRTFNRYFTDISRYFTNISQIFHRYFTDISLVVFQPTKYKGQQNSILKRSDQIIYCATSLNRPLSFLTLYLSLSLRLPEGWAGISCFPPDKYILSPFQPPVMHVVSLTTPLFLFPVFGLCHLLGSGLYYRHVCQYFLLRHHRDSIIVVLRWSLLPKETGLCFRRVRKIAKRDYQPRHISVYLPVCPHGKTRLSLGQILTNLDILWKICWENSSFIKIRQE